MQLQMMRSPPYTHSAFARDAQGRVAPALPCVLVGFNRLPYAIVLFLYMYETVHVIIEKMGTDSTDHEIGPWLRKKHDFDTVLSKSSTQV